MDELICVQFKGDVSDSLMPVMNTPGWGFSIHGEGKSAYIALGTKKAMERDILKRDDFLPMLVLDAVRGSLDEVASELIEQVMLEERGMMLNGIHVSHDDMVEASSSLGEE